MSDVQADRATPSAYVVRVQGCLAPRWASWFDGCTLTSEDGTTVLAGTVADQAVLHGWLQVLRDLGLPLLSVTPVDHGSPPA